MDNKNYPEVNQVNLPDNKTSLQKVGSFLKESRVGRNISIEDLSSQLRIGQEQLIALEKGNEKALPEKVFIKAMVRRIAEKLQLDTNFILEELNGREKSTPKIYPPQVKQEKVTSKSISFGITPIFILSGLLGLLASLILIRYIDNNQESYQVIVFQQEKYKV